MSSYSSENDESDMGEMLLTPTNYVYQKDHASLHDVKTESELGNFIVVVASTEHSSQSPDYSHHKKDAQSPGPSNDFDNLNILIQNIKGSPQSSTSIERGPLSSPTCIYTERPQQSLLCQSEENPLENSCCRQTLTELKRLKRIVASLSLTVSDKTNIATSEIVKEQIDFELPIQTKNQLTSLEEKLKDVITAAQYQQTIKQLGGKCVEKHVRNALVLTVSNTMAYKMSWTGAKNAIMVKNLIFIKLIIDTILKTFPEASIKKVEGVIKSWFHHAGDRLKYVSSISKK